MRGNPEFIKHKILEREDCPIKDIDVISIIMDEYEKQFNWMIQYNETPVIYRKGLGIWRIKNSKLRGHIRYLIKAIRELRGKKEKNPEKYTGSWGMSIEDTMIKRLRVCLKQLNQVRGVFAIRNELYLKKKNNKSKSV